MKYILVLYMREVYCELDFVFSLFLSPLKSLTFSIYLFITLYLSLSLYLSLFLFPSLSLSLSLTLSIYLSLFLSLSLSLYLCHIQLTTILSMGYCMDRRKCTRRELRTGAFFAWPMLYGWVYPNLMMVGW